MLTVLEVNTMNKLALLETPNSRVMCMCPVLPVRSSAQYLWLGLLDRSLQIIDCSKYHCVQETSTADVVSDMAASGEHVFLALAGGVVLAVNAAQPVKSGQLCVSARRVVSSASIRSIALVRGEELWCACGNGIVFLQQPGLEAIGKWCSDSNNMVSDLKPDDSQRCVWSFMWRTLDLLCWQCDGKRQLLLRLPLSDIPLSPVCHPPQQVESAKEASLSVSMKLDDSLADPLTAYRKLSPLPRRASALSPVMGGGDIWIQRILPVRDTLWVGMSDGRLLIADSHHMQLLAVLSAHTDAVRCLLYLPQAHDLTCGGIVLSGGRGMQPSMRYLLNHLQEAPEPLAAAGQSRMPGGAGHEEDDQRAGSILVWDSLSASNISLVQQRHLQADD